MPESIYMNPIRPQPFDGGDGTHYDGIYELVDYLPGTSIRFWYTSNPDCYDEHWHDPMEIISCEQGYYILEINHITYQVRPGDILLIPGGTVHTLCPLDNCRGYVHLVDLQTISAMKSFAGISPLLSRPILISESENHTLNHTANTLLDQMHTAYFSNNEFRELTVYSYLLLLLTEIGRNYLSTAQSIMHLHSSKHQEYADKFNQILNDLANHYNEEISLEAVARKYGFSKFYFSRLFNQYTSYSFTDYIASQRILAAKAMLMDLGKSITEIAENVGFNSLSSFNRVFKEKTGCNPSRYRELYHPLSS